MQIDSAQRVAQGSAKTTQATAACKNISKSKIKRSAKCAVWVASQPSISPQTANAAAHKVKKKYGMLHFGGYKIRSTKKRCICRNPVAGNETLVQNPGKLQLHNYEFVLRSGVTRIQNESTAIGIIASIFRQHLQYGGWRFPFLQT